MERFLCKNGPDSLSVPPSVVQQLAWTAPEQLHFSSAALEAAARQMEHSGWIRLPFCNTLCAEGLGARPLLSLTGARIKETPYNDVQQLPSDFSCDFPRMSALLAAVDHLSSDEMAVAYSIEGPFTLLTSLLPMGKVFSALRKPSGVELLSLAEKWIRQYTDVLCSRGIKLLSFADPVATPDIIGERMFTSIYVPCLQRILKEILLQNPKISLFLCGKMTQSLLDCGICHTVAWLPDTHCDTFGQALSAFCTHQKEGAILGHFCLNLLDAKRPYVEQIIFDK